MSTKSGAVMRGRWVKGRKQASWATAAARQVIRHPTVQKSLVVGLRLLMLVGFIALMRLKVLPWTRYILWG